jgi:hypothetical protein
MSVFSTITFFFHDSFSLLHIFKQKFKIKGINYNKELKKNNYSIIFLASFSLIVPASKILNGTSKTSFGFVQMLKSLDLRSPLKNSLPSKGDFIL